MTHEERLEAFREIDVGCVTDALIHYGIGQWTKGIFPVNPDAKVYGRAVTAKFDIVTPPRTEITPLECLEMCAPGDVMVWNADLDTNLMGGNIFAFAKRQGVCGIVLEGYHRDSDEIAALGGQVFSKGSSCGSSPTNFKATKESINIPVTVGGITICPGDYVCGDRDGVMVIPADRVDEVIAEAKHHMEWEKAVKTAIASNYTAEQMKIVYETGALIPDAE